MIRGIWGDDEKFKKSYFSDIYRENRALYFSGDGAYYDEEGYIFITGRVDDVVNISGHRIGIAEVENIVNANEKIAECAIVGISDKITGEALFGFVTLMSGEDIDEITLIKTLNASLVEKM